MSPKVSFIHERLRLEDFPENHQRMIREANEAAALEKSIEGERSRIETTLQSQDSPHFDESKVRTDFTRRLEAAIQKLKIPKKELMLSICRSEFDEERAWIDIKTLIAQMVLWIRTRQIAHLNRKRAECKVVRNPIEVLSKMEQGADKAFLGESYCETAKLLGYQGSDYPAIMQIIDRQMKNEERMRK